MPYHILNYLWRITTMDALDFSIGNSVWILTHIPSLCIFASVSDFANSDNAFGYWSYLLTAIGIGLIIFVVCLVVKYVKKEIKKSRKDWDEDQLNEEDFG